MDKTGERLFMALLAELKNKVLSTLNPHQDNASLAGRWDYLTLFGRLLYEVAAVSSGISEEELTVIRNIMVKDLALNEREWQYTYQMIEELAKREINFRRFTSEFNKVADYNTRLDLLEALLKVASADGIIEKVEFAKIKWIANYLWITPKDFNGIKDKYRALIEF